MFELFEPFKFFKFGLTVILHILLEMGIYSVRDGNTFLNEQNFSWKKNRFEIVRTKFFTEQKNFPIGLFFYFFPKRKILLNKWLYGMKKVERAYLYIQNVLYNGMYHTNIKLGWPMEY